MKKRIRLYLQRLIGNLFDGTFSSYLNAPHGLELDELRQYQPGDDIRSVDWKTTAKTGRLHVRMNLVDKRVTILFLVDKSRSEKFGSFINTKEDIQSRVLSILVYAASKTGNEIGFIPFTDKIEGYIQPKAGEKEALKNIKNILLEPTTRNGTDLDKAFKFLIEKIRSTALVFIMSDFFAPYNYEQSFKILAYLHEVIPIIISDRAERDLPYARGYLTTLDIETNKVKPLEISTTLNKPQPCISLFRKLNIDYLAISTDENEETCIKKISAFFDRRIRMGGRRRR